MKKNVYLITVSFLVCFLNNVLIAQTNTCTKFGVLVNGPATVQQKANVSHSINAEYIRENIILSVFSGTDVSYDTYLQNGFKIISNLTWNTQGDFPNTSTALTSYGQKISQVLQNYRPEVVVIENEELNGNFHPSGTARNYVNMLATAAPIVHNAGLKMTDGGIYGAALFMLIYRDLYNNFSPTIANNFGNSCLTPGQINAAQVLNSNPSIEADIKKMDSIIIGIGLYCDYANIHHYIDPFPFNGHGVTSQTVWPEIQSYIKRRINKECMTNETCIRNSDDVHWVNETLDTYKSTYTPYVIWYSYDDAMAGARGLQDQNYILRPTAYAFQSNVLVNQPLPNITVSATSSTICPGRSVTLTANGFFSYTWASGNAHTTTLSVHPNLTTVYTLTGSIGTCTNLATKTITVINPPITITVASSLVCPGQSAVLLAGGATTYTWLPNNSHGLTLTVTPSSTMVYTLTGSAGTCTNMATKTMSVINNLTVGITGNSAICSGNAATLTAFGAANYLWMPGASTLSIFSTSPLSTTVYTLTGSVGSCTAAALKTVSVNPSPTITVPTSNSVICQGQVVVLTASGAPNYTFDPGGVITNPASFTPTITTNYTVTGKASNGCKSKAYKTVSVSVCTDISEIGKQPHPVLVYPNPANNILNINLKEKMDINEEFLIVLMDVTGKEVLRKNYLEAEFSIDVNHLSEGMYILKIIGNQREYVQKVVIKN